MDIILDKIHELEEDLIDLAFLMSDREDRIMTCTFFSTVATLESLCNILYDEVGYLYEIKLPTMRCSRRHNNNFFNPIPAVC